MAKSTVWAWDLARRVTSDVGSAEATAAMVSSPAVADASRAVVVASWMRRKRYAMSISLVGTSRRASENALEPDSLVRVLIAMDARSCSTGAPTARW